MFNRRFNTTFYGDTQVKHDTAESTGEGTSSPYSVLVMIGGQSAIAEGTTDIYNIIRLMIGRADLIAEGTIGLALVVKRRSPKLLTVLGEGTLVALWSSVENGPFTQWTIKKLGTEKEI